MSLFSADATIYRKGLLLTDLFMYFNFVPLGFFQLRSIDYLWIDRKTLVNRSLYKEFIKGTTRVENITPGPRLMLIHLVQYSTSARSRKEPQIFT
jgi:hypothetical protein